MSPLVRKLMMAARKGAVFAYRRSGGKVGGRALGGSPVLLLTVKGRSTGVPRTTPVSWFEHDGGYVVVGSGGGSTGDPQWFRNLRRAGTAEVEVGRDRHAVTVRELKGAERAQVWRDLVTARVPAFARYPEKAGRDIPLALLTPTS
ncbi:MAG TPA: nitroreductase/quinone reductase family protein [Pedococcus sp.]|jgi:deazaflavin-dependent oxidoreductase (nitroreductase family)|nr:nitroreductase/quinone reductase family protein [Pedococcus sp.]